MDEKKDAGRLEVKLASEEVKERPVSLSMILGASIFTTTHLFLERLYRVTVSKTLLIISAPARVSANGLIRLEGRGLFK